MTVRGNWSEEYGIDRRSVLKALGVGTLASGLGTSSAAALGHSPLVVSTACGDDGGVVVITNTGDETVEVRDIDGAGMDIIDGRPTLGPGEQLVFTGVPDGVAVVQAFDPDTGVEVGGEVQVVVDCAETPAGPALDPAFGLPTLGPSPCGEGADEDCLASFPPSIRPDHRIEAHTDLPELLFFALSPAAPGGPLTEEEFATIADVVADFEVTDEERESLVTGHGEERGGFLASVAEDIVGSYGFHFDKVAVHVQPGDVVMLDLVSSEHGVTYYHERFGRQNRIPMGVPPVSSPMLPYGGYWLVRIEQPGVYQYFCAPHEFAGMVGSLVCHPGDDPATAPGDEFPMPAPGSGLRPPEADNLFSLLLGLDLGIPSALDALEHPLLDPPNVVADGEIHWMDLVDTYREGPTNGGG